MLDAIDVLPFLTHEDPNVRDHASKYFTDLGDAAPPQTANALWDAIDKFGEYRTELGTLQRQRFLLALVDVPKDDSAVTRVMDFLNSPGLDEDALFSANEVVARIPIDILLSRKDQILPVVSEALQLRLNDRISLHSTNPDEIWRQLTELAEMAKSAKSGREIPHSRAERLTEALGNHSSFSISAAMQVLADPQDRWWLETWCTQMLGKLRHTPAIDLLLEKMNVEDADILRQTAGDALSRLDPAVVIPRLEANYASDDPFFRMDIASAIGNTKHPLAETTLIRLLETETSVAAVTGVCCDLCDLCTNEGLEPIRQVVLANRYDTKIADVRELLVTLATMTGFQPPELPQWKVQLRDPVYKQKLRNEFLKSFGMNENMVQQFRKYLMGQPLEPAEESEATTATYEPTKPVLPYRRDQPKIGRNDPCTCGSGKKFKKCCGA